jgi:hypothetical protein
VKINWGAAGWVALLVAGFWFLNWNGSLQRYNDQIANCQLSRDFVTSQNAEGWVIAEHARHAASMRFHFPADHIAVLDYHRIHRNLDHFLSLPCDKRYHRPGLIG